ncbi:MAG: cytochrome P450 [Polyangiales bacterium]
MRAPGPNALQFILGVRQHGFLEYVGRLWREHGDVFQVHIGRKTLVFAMHPDAVERINVSHRSNYDKRESYEPVRQFLTGEGLVASTGELWKRQRKLMAPFFTPKGVQAYAAMMLRDSVTLAERWERLAKSGAEIEIPDEMTRVTASIILQSMFSTGALDAVEQIRAAVETMIAYVDSGMTGIMLPLWVPTAKNRKYVAARDLVHGLIADLIARRRAIDEAQWPDDLLSRLMRTRDEETGRPMSESLLRDESITTFFAGHETTARTMTFAWYALGANPAVREKLHSELDRALGGREPTVEDLRQLPYALQIVKETLRLYPAAPFYVRDAIGPDRIGEFDIPANASVMLSPFYTHRHRAFWKDAERFDPDRWTRENEAAQHSHQYHPFAAGPRICIGNNFSLLESHLLLAVLAQRFAPRLRRGWTPKLEMRGTLGFANGLPMIIEAREPSAAA